MVTRGGHRVQQHNIVLDLLVPQGGMGKSPALGFHSRHQGPGAHAGFQKLT